MSPRLWILVGLVALSGTAIGCGSTANTNPWEGAGSDGEGGAPSTSSSGSSSGSNGGSSSGNGSSSGGNASADAGKGSGSGGNADAGSSGGEDASTADTGTAGKDSGSPAVDSGSGQDAGSVTSDDGFAASRTACINKINALRATDTAVKLQPYTLENTDTTNTCVDTQATTDQSKNSAHWSFINNSPSCTWGSPSGYAQDECEQGYGTSPTGIEQCLQDMWDESLKPNCTGCVGCTTFGGACPNCDYSGTKGYECGHYVNMSAPYFTQVACGFAGAAPSSTSGWAVQNFE
ncbi:MAG TPA: hypothetical protein VIY73_28745 [Polyangiaceae bacterium]